MYVHIYTHIKYVQPWSNSDLLSYETLLRCTALVKLPLKPKPSTRNPISFVNSTPYTSDPTKKQLKIYPQTLLCECNVPGALWVSGLGFRV
jgi:hypothetical protein